jgi:hypothetical protein
MNLLHKIIIEKFSLIKRNAKSFKNKYLIDKFS